MSFCGSAVAFTYRWIIVHGRFAIGSLVWAQHNRHAFLNSIFGLHFSFCYRHLSHFLNIYFHSYSLTLQLKCARRAPLFVCSPNAAMIAATEGSHTRRLMNLIGFVCNVGEDHSSLDDRKRRGCGDGSGRERAPTWYRKRNHYGAWHHLLTLISYISVHTHVPLTYHTHVYTLVHIFTRKSLLSYIDTHI